MNPITSLVTRTQDWLTHLPLLTKATLSLCVVTTTLAAGIGRSATTQLCLNVYLAIWRGQIYRIVTSIFLHSGLLHLGFNMLAFVPTAKGLENQFGTIFLGFLLAVLAIIASSFYLLCSASFDRFLLGNVETCAMGISGVIFGLIVIETSTSGGQQRSIFGFFTVPAQYYPLVLLVICQLLLPHVSFWGHLGGIVAGQLLIRGALNFIVPSPNRLQAMENQRPFRAVSLWPSFVQNTSTGPIFAPESSLPISFGAGGSQTTSSAWQGWWSRVRSWAPGSRSSPNLARSASSSSRGLFGLGRGNQRGSQEAASSTGPPKRTDPKTAAAQAAEARFAKAQAEAAPESQPPAQA